MAGVAALPTDEFLAGLGPVLVVAPHPDDESIGCGGLIALLCQRALPLSVVLLSDGAMSHPGSRRFPAQARRALRWSEMQDALAVLGLPRADLHAMGWPDGALPLADDPAFAPAVREMAAVLRAREPQTVVLPWRRDPHRDHRAGHHIVRAAAAELPRPVRLLEYCVWTAERGDTADQPTAEEAHAWPVDISSASARKVRAVAAHRSQCGGVIDDDPAGFVLPAAMLARVASPIETYFEVRAAGQETAP